MYKICFFLTLSVLVCFNPCYVLFSGEINIKDAIVIIKRKEAEIHSLSWNCDVSLFSVKDNTNKPLGKAKVAFDRSARFCVDKEEIRQWIDGQPPTLWVSTVATFDGKILRIEQKHSDGTKIPDRNKIPEGTITQTTDVMNEVINWTGSPENIGNFFPYIGDWSGVETFPNSSPQQLSKMLQHFLTQKITVKITEDADGVWHIVYPYWYVDDLKIQVYCRVDYDPGKGRSGAILAVQKGDEKEIADFDKEPAVAFVLEKNEEFYVPKEVKIKMEFEPNGTTTKYKIIHYNAVVVNKEFSDTDFVIDWQKGTNVYDDVTKQFYVVTGDPIDEADAVSAFKKMHGLVPLPIISDNKPFGLLRLMLLLLSVLIVVYGIYRYFRRRA